MEKKLEKLQSKTGITRDELLKSIVILEDVCSHMMYCFECPLNFRNLDGEPGCILRSLGNDKKIHHFVKDVIRTIQESDNELSCTEKLDTVDEEPQQSENKELEALKIIRDTCSRYSGCNGCPYVNNNNTCGVNKYTPSKWILKGDKEIENRLFV